MPPVLTDHFGRRIDYLRLSVTDRCNLRCLYCEGSRRTPRARSEILRHEEVIRLAGAAVSLGVRKIRLTGGEPLLRRGLGDLAAGLASIPGLEELSVTSNGILLRQHAPSLRLAGVKRINVSLDTLKRRRFQEISGKNGLDDVLAGIQAARAEGLTPVKVNTVLIRDLNDDEIPAFLSFAQDAGVQLRFIEFMPVGWQDWAQGRVLPSREVRRRIASIASLEAVAPRDASPAANYRLKGTKTLVGFVSPISEPFCKRCNRLRLTADGHLRPCLFSDTEIDLKTPLRSGINEDGLRGLMLEALRAKPRNYVLRSPSRDAGPRPMAEIGG